MIAEFNLTHEDAAKAVGRSRAAVTNLLRLLNLAQPVREMLLANQIDMGHARALLAVTAAKQIEIANQVVKARLSVRQTEQWVARAQQAPRATAKTPDRDIARLEEEISDRLGTKVAIQSGLKGSGVLKISFQNLSDLDRVLLKLRA